MAHLPKGKGVIPLPPFQAWLASNIPAVYDNTMTYYEELCALLKYLQDQVVPALNENAEAITFLSEYVEHYFDNLDIQTEIDNKLDEMAESGQLTEIIAQYIQLNGVLAFDTKTAMKAGENMANGSICQTLGSTAISDGKGSLYKIRTITSGDVVDDDNIVALTHYPTLIAQKVIENRNKLLVFGDSWSMNGYPYITDQNLMWFRQYAKLHNMDVTSYAQSGAGYTVSGNTFDSQVTTAIANEIPGTIKQIIVFGGLNDISGYTYGSGTLYTAANSLVSRLKTNFPNAEIIVIGINTPDGLIDLKTRSAKGEIQGATLLNSARFINSNTFMQGFTTMFDETTNHHPNTAGQQFLGGVINSAIDGTYHREVIKLDNPYTVTKLSQWQPDMTSTITFYDNKFRIDFSIDVTAAYQANYEAIYEFPSFDLNYATFCDLLRPENNPTITPCVFKKGNSAIRAQITIPQGLTGLWFGHFEVEL